MPIRQLTKLVKPNATSLGLILITWLIFFIRTISGQYFYFLDDLKIIYYPLEVLYATAQANFTLPVWSNLLGFGQPVIAWGQLGFFTPLHVLVRALSIHPITLLQISVMSYFLVGSLSMFAFLRYRRLSSPAATLGAVTFTFSGFMIGHLNHVNFYTATTLLPLLLVAIEALLAKPTLPRTAGLTLVATAIALSGQPQIVLYTLIIGTIYGLIRWGILLPQYRLHALKPTALVLLAAVLFLALSSFAILPLREFQPLTERGADLTTEELFEFSYPPAHAITLILPTFFGDKNFYWGAKNFQELAAYTGLLPLLLAGVAAATWYQRPLRSLRLFAVILITISLAFALGKYSRIYTYLVENHLLTTLTTPGRFVYFFNVAISILAALGLDDLLHFPRVPRWQRLVALGATLLATASLFAPFVLALSVEPTYLQQVNKLLAHPTVEPLLVLAAILVFPLALMLVRFPWWHKTIAYTLTSLTAVTLVSYGWNYNPLVHRPLVFATPAWLQQLNRSPVPDRIYGRENINEISAISTINATPPISRNLTIIQPFTEKVAGNKCLRLRLYTPNHQSEETVTASLATELTDSPIMQVQIKPSAIRPEQTYTPVCFDQVIEAGRRYFLTLSAPQSQINTYLEPATNLDERAYIIRVTNPTPAELAISQKNLSLDILEEPSILGNDLDPEIGTLNRHLNVVAGISSARWIGALSIKPYREFIEDFFKNDRDDLLDGEGRHFLEKNRALLDSASITHLSQFVPKNSHDLLTDLNFEIIGEHSASNGTFRLYRNPQAYPKAYLVPNAIAKAAPDETRVAISEPAYDPKQTVYISGDQLPGDLPPVNNQPLGATVNVTQYEDTHVEVAVTAPREAWLVVTDSTTPQWHTFVDNQPAPYYIANSVFKAARVPAGQHTVSFRYDSPAIGQAKLLTTISLPLTLVLLIAPTVWSRIHSPKHRQVKRKAAG